MPVTTRRTRHPSRGVSGEFSAGMPVIRGYARDPRGRESSPTAAVLRPLHRSRKFPLPRAGVADDRRMCTAPDAIVSYSCLRGSGLSRRQIGAHVGSGALVRIRKGVYARSGACAVVRTAAQHGGRPGCVAAARHLGLWVLSEDSAAHVWLGAHGHEYAHEDCACVTHWDDGSASDSFGLASVPRILRQILACRGVEEFFVTLESALSANMVSRAGLAWLRTVANDTAREAIAFARADAGSGLESLLRWRLRRHGLQMRSQVTIVSVGIVDFLIGESLIIEVDGRENHEDSSKRHKDLVRDANAAVWGYITLRFDYAMVVHDWETVELAILAHVDRALHLRRPGTRV